MVQPRQSADRARGCDRLRQSDALFQHTVHLHEKIEALPQGEVRAVGVSTRPRAVEGLVYALLSGRKKRRAQCGAFAFCAAFRGIPSAGAYRGGGAVRRTARPLDSRFLAWHLSGGTSELLYVECGADGLPDCTCIGGTTDLAARSAARPGGRTARAAVPVGRGAG